HAPLWLLPSREVKRSPPLLLLVHRTRLQASTCQSTTTSCPTDSELHSRLITPLPFAPGLFVYANCQPAWTLFEVFSIMAIARSRTSNGRLRAFLAAKSK